MASHERCPGATMYAVTKGFHYLTVVISIGFFLVRAAWMVQDSSRLGELWVRIAPHAVDTVLLVTGVLLVIQTERYPLPDWLLAKLTAVLFYIVLGSLALRRAPTRTWRIVSLGGALVAAGYVVSVAFTRSTLPGLG